MAFGVIAQVSIALVLCDALTAGGGNVLPLCRTGDGTWKVAF
jgi:hypothetical protein